LLAQEGSKPIPLSPHCRVFLISVLQGKIPLRVMMKSSGNGFDFFRFLT
jgi:hypothetical protein